MSVRISVRVLVWSAVLAWPAVETYRLYHAKQELASSTQLQEKVSARLADARAKSNTRMATATEEKK